MRLAIWPLMFLALLATATTAQQHGNCNYEGMQLVQMRKQMTEPLMIHESLNSRHTGCTDCCNDGNKVVPCLDVDVCAANGPEQGKYAVAFSYIGKPPRNFLPNLLHMRKHAGKTDLILFMTKADAQLLDAQQKRTLYVNNVKLRLVDWAVPPDMVHHRHENWCGAQDFVRLHALAMEEYDAVAYYDTDVELQGDITPMLRCAAIGRFLTTNGGLGEPLSLGFFAARPDRRLLLAALAFARNAPFDVTTGWAGIGFAPSAGKFVGAECGQGFFHALFYKTNSSASQLAFAEAGLNAPGALVASQIDRCVWNYQTSFMCAKDFDCTWVRAHHKPALPGSNSKECLKSNTRWSPASLVTRSNTYGFWFPIHGQEANVLRVVRQVRRFYPRSPILILDDGGQTDFTEVCKLPRYGCMFERGMPENSRWNPHSWFVRMRSAAQKLGTDYLIYLEPDVMVTKRHEIDPPFDAGGVFDSFSPKLSPATVWYLENLGQKRNPGFRVRWTHFGLTGGTYLRTEAVLDAFDPANVARLDFKWLLTRDGDRVWSSDIAMHLALSARGWVVYPWQEAAQHYKSVPEDEGDRTEFAIQHEAYNPLAAFQHDHKERYNEPVPQEEASLLHAFNDLVPPDVTCHGCVWYKRGKQLPIPSQAPEAEDPDAILKNNGLIVAEAGSHAMEPPAAAAGLNIDFSAKPSWLVKADGLVADTRWNKERGGGILMAQAIMINAGEDWGSTKVPVRAGWLRAILATNAAHVRHHNHAMVIRWQPTEPQLTPWQLERCQKENTDMDRCKIDNERENFNWEKHLLLSEYLENPENFEYVIMLDADAALVRPAHNTLAEMAALLESTGKDVLVADEDWLLYGEGRINGGLIFARNNEFTRKLFKDLFECHFTGFNKDFDLSCTSNDQIALNDLNSKPKYAPHFLITSGKKFNRGGCTVHQCGEGISDQSMIDLGMRDPALEIMHFMGGSKFEATGALCDKDRDLTEGGPEGYGCKK